MRAHTIGSLKTRESIVGEENWRLEHGIDRYVPNQSPQEPLRNHLPGPHADEWATFPAESDLNPFNPVYPDVGPQILEQAYPSVAPVDGPHGQYSFQLEFSGGAPWIASQDPNEAD